MVKEFGSSDDSDIPIEIPGIDLGPLEGIEPTPPAEPIRDFFQELAERREAVDRIEAKFSDTSDLISPEVVGIDDADAAVLTIDGSEQITGKVLELGAKKNWVAGTGRFLIETSMKKATEEITGDALSGGATIGIRTFGYVAERGVRKFTDGDIIQAPDQLRAETCEGAQFADCAIYAMRGKLEDCPSFDPLVNKYSIGKVESRLDELLDNLKDGKTTCQSAQFDSDAEAKRRHHEWVVNEFHYVTVKEMDRELRRITETHQIRKAIREVVVRHRGDEY